MKCSISRMKLFKACRRAYYFKYIEDLEPVQKSEALQTGSNYHEIIEYLYNNDGCFPNTDFTKENAMAHAYFKYIYPKVKIKFTESWAEKMIGKHVLIGRVDGITEDRCIVEHKTTSMEIAEDYEFNLQWDEQILAYMYLTGARKVYYTICRKPTIRQRAKESDEDFFKRMIEWYDVDTDSKIRLLEIYRTDEDIQQFVDDFCATCDKIESAKKNDMYMNTQYCNHWGRRCEYSGICLNYDPQCEYIDFVKGGRT